MEFTRKRFHLQILEHDKIIFSSPRMSPGRARTVSRLLRAVGVTTRIWEEIALRRPQTEES